MQAIGRMISGLSFGATAFAGVMVVCLVLHVTADVVMRYVFEQPLNSTILYVSAYYMVAIAFLPLAAVEQQDSHIAVELLAEKFPRGIQRGLAIFAVILTVIVTATVAVRTGQEALAKYNTGAFSIEAGGKVITWPSYLFLPVGFGLMALAALWKLVAMVTGRSSGLSAFRVEDPYMDEGRAND